MALIQMVTNRPSEYKARTPVEIEVQLGLRGATSIRTGNRGLAQVWLTAMGCNAVVAKAQRVAVLDRLYNQHNYLRNLAPHLAVSAALADEIASEQLASSANIGGTVDADAVNRLAGETATAVVNGLLKQAGEAPVETVMHANQARANAPRQTEAARRIMEGYQKLDGVEDLDNEKDIVSTYAEPPQVDVPPTQTAAEIACARQGIVDALQAKAAQASPTVDPKGEIAVTQVPVLTVEEEVERIKKTPFGEFDSELTRLVIEARKPPVEIVKEVVVEKVVEKIVEIAAARVGDKPRHPTKKVREASWGELFGLTGPLGKQMEPVYDYPASPAIDPNFVWQKGTAVALTQIRRRNHVFFIGDPGTGKSTWAHQFAAVTHRPLFVLSCVGDMESAQALGGWAPDGEGGFKWRDNVVIDAIKTPYAVLCIDEISQPRSSVIMFLQNLLQFRYILLETGERVDIAEGVVILATDNTNGTGGGARNGFTESNRIHRAILERFFAKVVIEFLPPATEAKVLMAVSGCNRATADILVKVANLTRAQKKSGLIAPIGMRNLHAWAQMLVDGIEPKEAFACSVLNGAYEADYETLAQQYAIGTNEAALVNAVNGKVI